MHELAYGSEIVLYPPPHAHPLGSIRRMLLCPPPTCTLPGVGFFGSVAVTIVLRSFPVPREAGMYCDGLCPISSRRASDTKRLSRGGLLVHNLMHKGLTALVWSA